ncbi:7833_t:CDS:2, partial [Paraglomus brasilianum]
AKIAVSDGRIFFGTFVCVDKYKNMILAHTDEYRDDEKRFVGLVMIPGKHLVKAEIEDLDVSEEYI